MTPSPSRPATGLRRVLAALVCVVFVISSAACTTSSEDDARRLTTSESELLSAARFRNYDTGTRRIDVRIAGPETTTELIGYYDFLEHAGLVQVVPTDDGSTVGAEEYTNYVWWTTSVVGEAVVEGAAPDWEAGIPAIDSAWEWEFFEMDSSASTLLTTLALVSATGADRPDNPQLLAQSDALWLDSTEDGVWFQLPSSDEIAPATGQPSERATIPRFLVSDDGVIQRAEVTLADSSTATITFGPSDEGDVPLPDEVMSDE